MHLCLREKDVDVDAKLEDGATRQKHKVIALQSPEGLHGNEAGAFDTFKAPNEKTDQVEKTVDCKIGSLSPFFIVVTGIELDWTDTTEDKE